MPLAKVRTQEKIGVKSVGIWRPAPKRVRRRVNIRAAAGKGKRRKCPGSILRGEGGAEADVHITKAGLRPLRRRTGLTTGLSS